MRAVDVSLAGVLVVVLASPGLWAQPQRSTSPDADEAPIRRLIETTLPERYNAADVHGLAALWSDEATHSGLVAGARRRGGRAAIEEMWATGFAQPNRDRARRLSVAVTAIHFIRPDVAAVDALITYTGGRHADDSPRADSSELLFAVASRESGAWMITASRVVPLPAQTPR